MAPLIGGVLAALAHNAFHPSEQEEVVRLDVADSVPEAPDTVDVRDGQVGGRPGAEDERIGSSQLPPR